MVDEKQKKNAETNADADTDTTRDIATEAKRIRMVPYLLLLHSLHFVYKYQ